MNPEAHATGIRLSRHLAACAVEYLGDDMGHDWTIPGEPTHDPARDAPEMTFKVDTDITDELVMVGPDGQRYGVDVEVIAYPLEQQWDRP